MAHRRKGLKTTLAFSFTSNPTYDTTNSSSVVQIKASMFANGVPRVKPLGGKERGSPLENKFSMIMVNCHKNAWCDGPAIKYRIGIKCIGLKTAGNCMCTKDALRKECKITPIVCVS